jgi:hypothetical protein
VSFGQGGVPAPHGQIPHGHIPYGHIPYGHIPLTARGARRVQVLSWIVRGAAAFAVLTSLCIAGLGLIQLIVGHGGVYGPVFFFLASAGLAFFLAKTGASLEKVVTTDGADQEHFSSALDSLRAYFLIKAILIVTSLLLACGIVALMAVFWGFISLISAR